MAVNGCISSWSEDARRAGCRGTHRAEGVRGDSGDKRVSSSTTNKDDNDNDDDDLRLCATLREGNAGTQATRHPASPIVVNPRS